MDEGHILERVKTLLNSLEDSKSKMSEKGTWSNFQAWLDKPRNRLHAENGIRHATIEKLILDFRQIHGYLTSDTTLDREQKRRVENISTYEEKALAYKEAVEAYLVEPAQMDPFDGRSWYVYFFHLDERDQPSLGRAVLKGKAPDFVEIKNLPGLTHKNYEGKYWLVNNQACFFDLEARNKDRRLHIKVHFSIPERDEVLLGSYMTFENNRIVRGSIVMEPALEEDPTAKILSYKENLETFKAVNPAIRKYLMLKKYNYHKTPTGVHTYDDLNRYLNLHSENWKSHFIEEDAPTLFIASPGLSIGGQAFEKNKAALDRLVKKLEQKFSGEINIKIHNNQDTNVDLNLHDALQDLRKVRFFVLIYTKTDVGSYTLVQLGWALAHCKVVMIFYEDGSISEHVKSVPERVNPQSFTNLENAIDNIYNTIELQIRRSFKNMFP